MTKVDGTADKSNVTKVRRQRNPPSEIPRFSLREALTIAQAITDHFAGQPVTPLQIAMALDKSPTSSGWRYLTGAALAYGLTTGGYNAEKIGLQELGSRATAPREEGADLKAKAEAALKPKVLGEFFTKYNRSKFPPDNILKNVLMIDFGVPAERVDDVLEIIKDNGAYVGFIHQTKGGPFVSIDDLRPSPVTLPNKENEVVDEAPEKPRLPQAEPMEEQSGQIQHQMSPAPNTGPFKVFITHGKNMSIVEQVKDVLDLYDIDYEVAVEEETTAIPVPQKVLGAMRRCEAGIMIVSADDDASATTGAINNNVLIEIGAAFVLYDQKVVLLWDKQLKVPSNLQGLYRCEFEGGQLSFAAGTRLAKAVKGFRK